MRIPVAVLGILLLSGACRATPRPAEIPPPLIMGEFEDDYGAGYTIAPREWRHGRARYHIIKLNAQQQYLIAQNDAGNPGDPLLFTRIDWLSITGMPPYEWAFCMTAFNAATA